MWIPKPAKRLKDHPTSVKIAVGVVTFTVLLTAATVLATVANAAPKAPSTTGKLKPAPLTAPAAPSKYRNPNSYKDFLVPLQKIGEGGFPDQIYKNCDGADLIYSTFVLGNRDNSVATALQPSSPQCSGKPTTIAGVTYSPIPPTYPNRVLLTYPLSSDYSLAKFCDGPNLLYAIYEKYGAISLQLATNSPSCLMQAPFKK